MYTTGAHNIIDNYYNNNIIIHGGILETELVSKGCCLLHVSNYDLGLGREPCSPVLTCEAVVNSAE